MATYGLADRFNCSVAEVLHWTVEEFNTRLAYARKKDRRR